jgi:sugar phosphate isomerase/epimerase
VVRYPALPQQLPCTTVLYPLRKRGFFELIGKPIGVQLYTLCDDFVTDIDGMLAKVANIGFRDLQLPQLFGKSPAELEAAGDRACVKLSCVHLAATSGTPASALSMLSSTKRIVDDLGALGATGGVIPIMLFPKDFKMQQVEDFRAALSRALIAGGVDTWNRTAALLNEKAAVLKPHNIQIGYHNHNMEFAPIGKTTGWEILASETDKSLVKFEVDIGWVAAGGLDPVTFLNKYKGRLRWLHVKDVQRSTKTNYALQMDPTEVGLGK